MKTYETPEIFELGGVEEHTFGATGPYCEAGDGCCDQQTRGGGDIEPNPEIIMV